MNNQTIKQTNIFCMLKSSPTSSPIITPFTSSFCEKKIPVFSLLQENPVYEPKIKKNDVIQNEKTLIKNNQ